MNRVEDNLVHTGSNAQIVREFQHQGVEFILIGGLAVAWYCVERQADDMDLLVNSTVENSAKVALVLANLLPSPPSTDAFARPNVRVRLNHHFYADVMTQADGGMSYEEVMRTSEPASLFDIPIRVPSIQSLVTLKKHAIEREEGDTQKHADDIELLNRALKSRR